MKNYLPFVTREVLRVGAASTAQLSAAKAQVAAKLGGCGSTIYQDVSFNNINDDIYIKYGYEDRGYLLEEGIPSTKALNGFGGLGYLGWRFPRPYRIDPGKSLIVTFENDSRYHEFFGVTFPCKRVDNGEPYFLYGANLTSDASGAITGATMKCPAETSLFVEGIATGNYTNYTTYLSYPTPGIQMYDAEGNEVVKVKPNGTTTFSAIQLLANWTGWPINSIELGEENGWKLPSTQPIILELENRGASDVDVLVTLRGSLEV